VQVDVAMDVPIDRAADLARAAEDAGYDGICCAETVENPLMTLLLCASVTSRVALLPTVAVAFARTPMVLAYDAAAVARSASTW
jgi:alkanesulfonate monooxygenase SsuD/methylene tetrahydromethanopterin reductase-like flavin-dependent oxidoreductase (luciferase family)